MSQIIGQHFPSLTAAAVMPDNTIDNNFNISGYIKDRVGVLFFYPLDFTFVCPSEIIALDEEIEEFKKRNVALATVSIDSQYSHLAYKNTPRENGGIGHVRFPMISDLNKQIALHFHALAVGGVALRATIITDRNGIIRHYSLNDLPIGRNIDEIIRVVDAIEHFTQHGEVCPAGWQAGQKAMKPTHEGVVEYLKEKVSEIKPHMEHMKDSIKGKVSKMMSDDK
jgi:peroxiredoxin (alkyl hydroperoxide reductase subunit C)